MLILIEGDQGKCCAFIVTKQHCSYTQTIYISNADIGLSNFAHCTNFGNNFDSDYGIIFNNFSVKFTNLRAFHQFHTIFDIFGFKNEKEIIKLV